MFYVDLLLSETEKEKDMKEAVDALKAIAEDVRLLGIYNERSV